MTDRPSHRFTERLFAPVDVASLVFFRVSFGLLMAWDVLHYTLGGRMRRFYVEPVFHFKYLGFEWVKVGPEWVMGLVFWALFILALAIAAGFLYRWSAALFFIGYAYVFLLDQATYNNHNYLVCLLAFLMIFLPAHRAGSLDAWRRPGLRSKTVPAWTVWLLRFQVGVPYFFGGLAKLNADWLVEAQPMRLWLSTGSVELQWGWLRAPAAAYFFSWGGVLFDLLVVPALLWKRTRPWAYALAVAFHLNNVFLFDIGFFPWLMIAATTIFFEPDWPRRVGLTGKRARGGGKPKTAQIGRGSRRLVVTALALWMGWQVLMPVRPLLYPGNPDWTDYAHRFAWRMKLREKRGEVRFSAVDPTRRRVFVLEEADALLTRRQWNHMIQDPHMIRQFAHFLAVRLEEGLGREGLEIRVRASLALNGREPQPLIDPEVDLASQPGSWRPVDWVLLLEDGAPDSD